MSHLDELARMLRKACNRFDDQAHIIAHGFSRGFLPSPHRLGVYEAARDIKLVAYLTWHLEAFGCFPGRRRQVDDIACAAFDVVRGEAVAS